MSAARTRYSGVGGSLTPVFDLLFILTIAFIGVGIFLASTLRLEVGVTAMKQHVAEARAVEELDQEKLLSLNPLRDRLAKELEILEQESTPLDVPQSDIDRRHGEVAKLKARLASVNDVASRLEREIARLRQQLAAAEDEAEHAAHSAMHQKALEEFKQLEAQRVRYQNRLAKIQAELARAQADAPTFTGAAMVRPDRQAEKTELLLLSKGRVLPFPEYFSQESDFFSTTARPSREGLTIEEALKPGSIVMKKVAKADFKRRGRAVLLVNPDSFATFRALRDSLVEQGIDYGWEPWEDATIVFSGQGRNVESQGASR